MSWLWMVCCIVGLLYPSPSTSMIQPKPFQLAEGFDLRSAQDLVNAAAIAMYSSKSKLTQEGKKQLENALKSANSISKFFKSAKFTETLTLIGTLGGPIFAVSLASLNIVFLFYKLEAPEITQLKLEIENINKRLDQWSAEFDDIVKQIDWSAIQIAFGDYERSIRIMADQLQLVLNSPEDIRDQQKELFLTKYESNFLSKPEKFYDAMISTNSLFSDNLFAASQKITQYYRRKVQEFMLGNVQLLMKAVQIQASYIQLRYNNTHANEFTMNLWNKRFSVLSERMNAVDLDTQNQWEKHAGRDLITILKDNEGVSNAEFVSIAYQFFSRKYDWREWLVLAYNVVEGSDKHSHYLCKGWSLGHFNQYGRNVQLPSFDREAPEYQWTPELVLNAQKLLNTYSVTPHNTGGKDNHASSLMGALLSSNQRICEPYKGISVIAESAKVYFEGVQFVYRRVLSTTKTGGSTFPFYAFLLF